MGIWGKLVTAVRGGATEVGEAIVDNQALRILDQEIRDADSELHKSKTALANIMAKHRLANDKLTSLKTKVSEYEGYAMQALEKGDEALAVEIAEKIGSYQSEILEEQTIVDNYGETVTRLRSAITQAGGNLKRLRQQVDTVKATASVQKAQAAVAQRYSGANSKMATAMDSLERIKAKQLEHGAQMDAAEQLSVEGSDSSLENKMKAIGIKPGAGSAQDILLKLKAKQLGQSVLEHDKVPRLPASE